MTRIPDLVTRVPEQHRLLLAAALGPADVARAAWQEWRRSVVFDDVDGAAARLLPVLARRSDVVGADDPLHGRIRGLYRKAWVSNERLLASGRVACRAIAESGVPLLHVEALPLARAVGDHGLRPLYDLDVCVPVGRTGVALGVLDELGWTMQRRGVRARWQRRPVHVVRDGARLRVIQRVPWPGADTDVWRTAAPADEPGESMLDMADVLVHAAVRSVQPWQAPGQWVADAMWSARALGLAEVGQAADDERVMDRARIHGCVEVVRAAVVAVDRIVGQMVGRG